MPTGQGSDRRGCLCPCKVRVVGQSPVEALVRVSPRTCSPWGTQGQSQFASPELGT